MKQATDRLPLIDTLKALASQLIVLHHLAFYGPMSDVALPLAPDAISWLYDYARMAVQVFLVLAGFLAARSLAPAAIPGSIQPAKLIWQRYYRLALPLAVALFFSILSAALARQLLNHEAIPAAPTLWQMLTHALLLQGLLGQESLSAGVWYIAIDFQLFAMLCLILGLVSKLANPARVALWLVASLACASLLYFNLQGNWDNWGLYFFGAYGLGVIAQWSSRHRHGNTWLLLLLALGCIALTFEFRPRIALAFTTAVLLTFSARCGLLERWPDFRLCAWLGRISYSVFLIHFPVCMLINALVSRFIPDSPVLNLAGMLTAWILSIAAGHLFYKKVETGLRPEAALRALRQAFTGA